MEFIKWLGKIIAGLLGMIGIVGIPEDIETIGDWYSSYIAPNFNTSLVQWLSVLVLAILLVDLIRRYEKWNENKKPTKKNKEIDESKKKIKLPNLSLAWSTPSPNEFIEDASDNYCFFTCFDTPKSKSSSCQLITGGGGMHSLDYLKTIQEKGYNIHKLVITNHSKIQVFKACFPSTVACWKVDEEGNEFLSHTEEVNVASVSINGNSKMILYLHNSSKDNYVISIYLKGYIEGSIFNTDKRINIKYTWESMEPLAIALRPNR